MERVTAGKHASGLPLSLVILRYFAYVLVSGILVAAVCFSAFILIMNAGLIHPADYGESALPEIREAVSETDSIDNAMIPSCYWWLHLSPEGEILDGDMSATQQGIVLDAIATGETQGFSARNTLFALITMKDGSSCALAYQIVPQFASKELRDTLPNPQDIMTSLILALFILSTILIAIRAAHVLSRKMQPLIQTSHSIGEQDLDFAMPQSNIREINEILDSMDSMKASLKDALEAQWKAEQSQRQQISALAHDLKTPLTIIKGNIDLISESDLDDEQRSYVQYASDGVAGLEANIASLIGLSRSLEEGALQKQAVDTKALSDRLLKQAEALVRPFSLAIAHSANDLPGTVDVDAAAIERAFMNIVSNAVDHSPQGGTIAIEFGSAPAQSEGQPPSLVIAIADEGLGFSDDELLHAKERFYRGDSSRTDSSHFGLGLSIATSLVELHGGTIDLGNAEGGGACVRISLPVHG